MSRALELDTSLGPCRFLWDGSPDAPHLLVLGHGAGGGVEAPDLCLLAEVLPAAGDDLAVARFEQPWRTAGRRVAPAPARLDQAWTQAVGWLQQRTSCRRMVLGGRSAGARAACRTAQDLAADAVLALAFPLHPPGRPDRSRLSELVDAGVECLVVQGSRDPLGSCTELRAAIPPGTPVEVLGLEGAAHDLQLPRRHPRGTRGAWEELVPRVVGLVRGDPEARQRGQGAE